MAITRWDPFRELEDMSGRLNRLFGRSELTRFPSSELLGNVDFTPPVDVVETTEEFVVKAELPDIKKDDIKISMDDGVLRISGERKHEKEEKNKKYHRVERSYGSFMRAFQLPSAVDEAKAHAEFKDGVLSIKLPKTQKTAPKAIDIKIG